MFLPADLKRSYRGRYVSVGCCVGKEESHVWTVSLNEESNSVPLVLLHGFGSGVGLWCLNLDALAADRPVYAMDIIGKFISSHFCSSSFVSDCYPSSFSACHSNNTDTNINVQVIILYIMKDVCFRVWAQFSSKIHQGSTGS